MIKTDNQEAFEQARIVLRPVWSDMPHVAKWMAEQFREIKELSCEISANVDVPSLEEADIGAIERDVELMRARIVILEHELLIKFSELLSVHCDRGDGSTTTVEPCMRGDCA